MTRVGHGARRAATAALVGLCATAALGWGSIAAAEPNPTPTVPTTAVTPSTDMTQLGGQTQSTGPSQSTGQTPSGGQTEGGIGSGDPAADAVAGLACTPLDPKAGEAKVLPAEQARLVIVTGPGAGDRTLAEAVDAASKDKVQVVGKYALGAEPPPGYQPLEGANGANDLTRLESTPGPFIVAVIGGEASELRTSLQRSAFVYPAAELGIAADNPLGGIVDRYDQRVAGLLADERLDGSASQAALITRWTDGSLVVDVDHRAGRAAIEMTELTVAGQPLCDGTATAPFRVQASGSEDASALVGAQISGQIAGLANRVVGTVAMDDPGGGGVGTTSTTEPKADDDGGGGGSNLGLIVGVIALMAVAGLVGLVLLLRKKDEPAAEPWMAAPGPVPPPSPHGPSPTSYQGGGSAPFAGAAPIAVAPAPVVAPPTGRAVTPPAFAPLDLADPAPGWTAAVPGDGSVRISDLGLMRMQPMETEHGRTWSSQSSVAVGAAGWLEKKVGRGEDAEPTVRLHERGRGIVGVYDGTGGAGSAPARRLRDGTEQTGAFVASRLARDLVEVWYAGVVERGAAASDANDLRDFLAPAFRDEAEFSLDTSAGLKGSLSRVLPTTMALAAFGTIERDGRNWTLIDALWAGDSRSYLLTPTGGLQVLSVDDTRETDALALIRNDQPMDNLVSADRPFRINHRQIAIDAPAVILTATDGCFGYVKTPAHFEHLVLTSLRHATTLEGWAGEVIEALATFTADDASFALAAVGFPSFAALQAAFAERGAFIAEHHWAPFDGLVDDAAIEQRREQSWAEYRDGYHARLGDTRAP